jgi:dTDP-3-amino-3,4,6-trideoxy-alpha-D-glucose transaminase
LVHYPIPPHLQLAYADLDFAPGSFPIAERLADHVLSLPLSPHIGAKDVEQVVTAIRSARPAA